MVVRYTDEKGSRNRAPSRKWFECLSPPIGRIVFSSTYAIIRLLREDVRYPWLEVEADVLHELEASKIRYDDNSSLIPPHGGDCGIACNETIQFRKKTPVIIAS